MNSHNVSVTQNAAVCRTARICNQLRQHLSYESAFFFTHVQRANRPGERMNWHKYFGKCGSRVRTIKNKERWPCLTPEKIFMGEGLQGLGTVRSCQLRTSAKSASWPLQYFHPFFTPKVYFPPPPPPPVRPMGMTRSFFILEQHPPPPLFPSDHVRASHFALHTATYTTTSPLHP